MKKYIFSLALLAMASAANAQTIEINYNGAEATVNIPAEVTDVQADVDGAHVRLTSMTGSNEYTYRLTGASQDGSLNITGSYKLTLELDGVSLKSSQGAAIEVACGKRVAVVLKKGTENTLEDCENGGQKAAMYFTGHPEFSGAGTLNVKGNTAHAISAKEYLQLKKSLGTLNILGAVKDGIHCGKGKVTAFDESVLEGGEDEPKNINEYFFCNGGTVNISNCGGDCIDAGDYGCMNIKGGDLNLTVTSTDTSTGNYGLKSVNTFIQQGGHICINVQGDDCDGLYVNNEARLLGGTLDINVLGDGSKGIKAKQKATGDYPEGGHVTVADEAEVSIAARGGDYNDQEKDDVSHCVGLSVDGNLTVGSEARVMVASFASDARTCTFDGTLTGKVVEVTSAQPGDMQPNGKLDAEDVQIALDFLLGNRTKTVGYCKPVADYNQDGKVSIEDIAKLIDKLI